MDVSPHRKIAATLVLLVAGVSVVAEETGQVDPSRPTNLYSSVGASLAWGELGTGDTWGARLLSGWAPNRRNEIQLEIRVQHATFPGLGNETGLGDVRVSYFGLPLVRDGSLTHIGALLDVSLPTGDEHRGLGTGATVVAPGLLFGLAASDILSFYPTLRLHYASSAANCTAGGPDAVACVTVGPGQADDSGTTEGWSMELLTVIALPSSRWLQVIPKYSEVIEGPESTSLSLQLNYGMMLLDDLAFSIDLLHEFDNREGLGDHVRLGLEFFF